MYGIPIHPQKKFPIITLQLIKQSLSSCIPFIIQKTVPFKSQAPNFFHESFFIN